MKIAGIGYVTKGNRITVSYDTVEKKYIVREEYRETWGGFGFSYKVKSREEARESLERFKKDFAWNK